MITVIKKTDYKISATVNVTKPYQLQRISFVNVLWVLGRVVSCEGEVK